MKNSNLFTKERERQTNNNNNFLRKSDSTLKIDSEGTCSPIGLESSALFCLSGHNTQQALAIASMEVAINQFLILLNFLDLLFSLVYGP